MIFLQHFFVQGCLQLDRIELLVALDKVPEATHSESFAPEFQTPCSVKRSGDLKANL